jgi:hypothetical protein
MFGWLVVLWAPGVIAQNLGWPWVMAFYLLVLLIVAPIRVQWPAC